jgi:hypothetical protein
MSCRVVTVCVVRAVIRATNVPSTIALNIPNDDSYQAVLEASLTAQLMVAQC